MQHNAITHTSETDVLVIGAGPVGLMLACELSRRDIACRILDTVSDFPQTSRATFLQPRSMEVLDSLGVVDQIVARGMPVHGASVRQGRRELRSFEETSGCLVAQVADLASEEVERVEAKWLVGCDGAHSTVRKQLQ